MISKFLTISTKNCALNSPDSKVNKLECYVYTPESHSQRWNTYTGISKHRVQGSISA